MVRFSHVQGQKAALPDNLSSYHGCIQLIVSVALRGIAEGAMGQTFRRPSIQAAKHSTSGPFRP